MKYINLNTTNPQAIMLVRKDPKRKTRDRGIPNAVQQYIDEWVDWQQPGEQAILETSSPLNLINFATDRNGRKKKLDSVINLKRINDIRYINKFFEAANENLSPGGLLIGCLETAYLRRQRLMNKFGAPFNRVYFLADYLVKRVWPKLPYLKKAYFFLTCGRNRVVSEMESIGRLYSCGFKLLDIRIIDGLQYFVAEKTGTPAYNMEATYGPLIKLNRIGKDRKPMKVYKFRTMYPYSEYAQQYIYERQGLQEGGKFKNDPRVNTVGRVMRKCWLDELPMLYNFLKGDMKIFGVRPLSPHYLSIMPKEFQEYRQKFKPGLIPPVYVEIPKDLDDVVAIERRYLEAYEKAPWKTDWQYTKKALYNIFIKKIRSK